MSPTSLGEAVLVDGFTLTYILSATGTITDGMLEELREATEVHLDSILRSFYQAPVLFAFAKVSLDALVPPNQVDFTPTFFFLPNSAIPSDAQLRNALQGSFSGEFLQQYTEDVRALPSSNVFSSASAVTFQFTPSRTATPTSSPVAPSPPTSNVLPTVPTFPTPDIDGTGGGSNAGVLAAASAGAFVLVVAGYFMYRRNSDDTEPAGKFVDPDGHITVTGDTFANSMENSTYAGGESVDSGSPDSPNPYRSETKEWKEYHEQERRMMSESEWEEYQEALDNSHSESPFETIEEENEATMSNYGEDDDDSLPDRVLSEMDQVTP